MEKAILAVSFGTSYADSRAAAIEPVEEALGQAFPGCPVRRAFTSGMIIRSIKNREGIKIDTVPEAVKRLAAEGCRQLICQPTHIINGVENDEMLHTLRELKDRFVSVRCGSPLLTSDQDYVAVVEAVMAELAPPADTALVLMGHGTPHDANACYAALDYRFKQRGYRNVFVGAVEGYPQPEIIESHLKEAGYRKIMLAPLMLVAGDHAKNDMAGEGGDSWKKRFENAGLLVGAVLRGLGEYPAIRELYVAHARAAAQI